MRCSCGRDTHHETQVAIPVDTGLPSQTTVIVETTACPDCGRLAKPNAVDRAVKAAAVKVVVQSGHVSGKTFRFLRKALDLTGEGVASVLGLGVGTISRWENECRGVDPRAWAVLASLALEHVDDTLPKVVGPMLEAITSTATVSVPRKVTVTVT